MKGVKCLQKLFRVGVRVIPSAHIPDGYKFTIGSDIFVNSANYEDIRRLRAEEVLMVLGQLKSFGKEEEDDGRDEENAD